VTEKDGEFFFWMSKPSRSKGERRDSPARAANISTAATDRSRRRILGAIPDAEKNETQVGIYNIKTLSFKP
jgi:hypothetical protein